MSSFVRKVEMGSDATAVRIVLKTGGRRAGIEHIGSAHNDVDLHVLLVAAHCRLAGEQPELELGIAATRPGRPASASVVKSKAGV